MEVPLKGINSTPGSKDEQAKIFMGKLRETNGEILSLALSEKILPSGSILNES